EHALDGGLLAIETAGRELEVLVAAAVLHGVVVAVEIDHHDRGVAVPGHGGLAGKQFGGGADADPVGHVGSGGLSRRGRRSYRGLSRTAKRRSSRRGSPKRGSVAGNGRVSPVRR